MCALSHRIREQPNWWESLKDEAIVKKWREEALRQAEEDDVAPSKKLTPAMVRVMLFLDRALHPYFVWISRSIMCSRSSMDTHLSVIPRLG